MYFDDLQVISNVVTSLASVVSILVLVVAYIELRKNFRVGLLVLWYFVYSLVLGESVIVDSSYHMPIVAMVFLLTHALLAVLLYGKIEGKLRLSLLGYPALLLIVYLLNLLFTNGEMGLSIFSAWIA